MRINFVRQKLPNQIQKSFPVIHKGVNVVNFVLLRSEG